MREALTGGASPHTGGSATTIALCAVTLACSVLAFALPPAAGPHQPLGAIAAALALARPILDVVEFLVIVAIIPTLAATLGWLSWLNATL